MYALCLFVKMFCMHVETNRAEREVVLSNLDTLCSVALGEKVTEDFLLARDAVITICSITDHARVRRCKPGVASKAFLRNQGACWLSSRVSYRRR